MTQDNHAIIEILENKRRHYLEMLNEVHWNKLSPNWCPPLIFRKKEEHTYGG